MRGRTLSGPRRSSTASTSTFECRPAICHPRRPLTIHGLPSTAYRPGSAVHPLTSAALATRNLSYTCEPGKYVGKTSCAYLDLHFIYNKNTEEGDTSIQEWDDYQVGLHREAFELDTFDQFMDYR